MGQKERREEGGATERWAPGVGGGSAEEDVNDGNAKWVGVGSRRWPARSLPDCVKKRTGAKSEAG